MFLPVVLVLLFLSVSPALFSQDSHKLLILHTNDLHSRLEGYAPSSDYTPLSTGDDRTTGGFSRLAAVIEKERSEYGENMLLLDAGDFLMGTIYHYMEEYHPFQMLLMDEMGYDALALGNHEFDFGPDGLAKIINKSLEAGEIPPLLLGNAVSDKKDSADDSLEDLYERGVIRRSLVVERNGLKIGVFSLLGEDADESAPYAVPVTFDKITRSAKVLARELKEKGCDLVICLSHSGIEKDKNGEWTGEDVNLAEKVDDIDIIISGHSHTKLDHPLVINNTPVVQTGSYGKNVGRMEIAVEDGHVKLLDYRLVPLDDSIEGNRRVYEEILAQKELISQKLYRNTGIRVDSVVVETGFVLECNESGGLEESNLGPLVADAIHSYVNSETGTGTDISMVAAGVIRDRMEPGVQTTQDIFRIMSLGKGEDEVPGYPLARVFVNAKELKRILEILLVAYKSTPSNYCYYSGLEVRYDPGRGLLRKINSISLVNKDGELVPVDLSRKNEELYSITANAYMLEFIGIIQKMTFGLIKVQPKDADGNEIGDMKRSVVDFNKDTPGIQEGKEWIALVRYLSDMDDINGDGIPDMPLHYMNPGLCLVPEK